MSDTPDDGQEPSVTPPDPDGPSRPRVAQTTAIQRADDNTKSIEFGDDPADGTVEIIIQDQPEKLNRAEESSGEG